MAFMVGGGKRLCMNPKSPLKEHLSAFVPIAISDHPVGGNNFQKTTTPRPFNGFFEVIAVLTHPGSSKRTRSPKNV